MENELQKCSVEESKHRTPRQVLAAGMFWVFLIATLAAFLLHVFGLGWVVAKTAEVKEPSEFLQKIILALLKTFELIFAYKMLIHRSWSLCCIVSILQSVLTGFLPGVCQGLADVLLPLLFAIVLRKGRLIALLDWLFLELLMNAYSLIFVIANFGGLQLDYGYSFWANVVSVIDFKLFIVTIYAYAKSKGGIQLWKTKRRLLNLP